MEVPSETASIPLALVPAKRTPVKRPVGSYAWIVSILQGTCKGFVKMCGRKVAAVDAARGTAQPDRPGQSPGARCARAPCSKGSEGNDMLDACGFGKRRDSVPFLLYFLAQELDLTSQLGVGPHLLHNSFRGIEYR